MKLLETVSADEIPLFLAHFDDTYAILKSRCIINLTFETVEIFTDDITQPQFVALVSIDDKGLGPLIDRDVLLVSRPHPPHEFCAQFLEQFISFMSKLEVRWGVKETLHNVHDHFVPYIEHVFKQHHIHVSCPRRNIKTLIGIHSGTANLSLSDCFVIDSLRYDDLSIISKTWRSIDAALAADFIWKNIRCLPSSCIRLKRTGEPISYMFASCYGKLNHLYTKEEYRGQGLAKAVVDNLTMKALKVNMLPMVTVASDNTSSRRVFESLGWLDINFPNSWVRLRTVGPVPNTGV